MATPSHDWYLTEWAAALGKRPVDFVKDLEWNKSRVSLLFNGKQPYTREILNDVAAYLKLLPFELLMHPADAMAIRNLRQLAKQIAGVRLAADNSREWQDAPKPLDLTGNGG
jgi:hypothetical protein